MDGRRLLHQRTRPPESDRIVQVPALTGTALFSRVRVDVEGDQRVALLVDLARHSLPTGWESSAVENAPDHHLAVLVEEAKHGSVKVLGESLSVHAAAVAATGNYRNAWDESPIIEVHSHATTMSARVTAEGGTRYRVELGASRGG